MTAITADMFARTPPFAYAAEALNAIRAQHGRARAAGEHRARAKPLVRPRRGAEFRKRAQARKGAPPAQSRIDDACEHLTVNGR